MVSRQASALVIIDRIIGIFTIYKNPFKLNPNFTRAKPRMGLHSIYTPGYKY